MHYGKWNTWLMQCFTLVDMFCYALFFWEVSTFLAKVFSAIFIKIQLSPERVFLGPYPRRTLLLGTKICFLAAKAGESHSSALGRINVLRLLIF